MSERCPHCRRAKRKVNSRGLVTATCGREDCLRAQRAEQKRRERQRKREGPVALPPVPDPSGPVDTPFGTFNSHKDAWLEVIKNSNIGRQWEIFREWADNNLDTDAFPVLDEVIGYDPDEPERFDQELST